MKHEAHKLLSQKFYAVIVFKVRIGNMYMTLSWLSFCHSETKDWNDECFLYIGAGEGDYFLLLVLGNLGITEHVVCNSGYIVWPFGKASSPVLQNAFGCISWNLIENTQAHTHTHIYTELEFNTPFTEDEVSNCVKKPKGNQLYGQDSFSGSIKFGQEQENSMLDHLHNIVKFLNINKGL